MVAEPLLAIVERDPDLAIFQILRQEGNYLTQYGVTHSIHCAFTVFLVAARFGWSETEVRRSFNAALTMNISMLELQGQLATMTGRPSEAQIALIESHPLRSRRMLETAGVRDADWLLGVEQHHPVDASGRRSRIGRSRSASLLHSADTYTAKLSPRRNREALGADVAARMMFTADRDDPATAALVKEFGLYPPGCQVRLANGESGRRGAARRTGAHPVGGGHARQRRSAARRTGSTQHRPGDVQGRRGAARPVGLVSGLSRDVAAAGASAVAPGRSVHRAAPDRRWRIGAPRRAACSAPVAWLSCASGGRRHRAPPSHRRRSR